MSSHDPEMAAKKLTSPKSHTDLHPPRMSRQNEEQQLHNDEPIDIDIR